MAHYGCGTTFLGQFWYFGGSDYFGTLRQVKEADQEQSKTYVQASKIEGCELVRQFDLPFDFHRGFCETFLQPVEQVLFCFDENSQQACHT